MPDKKNKKKKRYFLVDYENVTSAGLVGIESLESADSVIIFYSANANKMTFQIHTSLLNTKANVDYCEVDTVGQNALDFQLSSYIGYIIGKKSKSVCYIVSHDRGFENVCNFWRKRGAKLKIIPDISRINRKYSDIQLEVKNAIEEFGLSPEDSDFVQTLLFDTLNREDLTLPQVKTIVNQNLCRKFGSNSTKEIYAKIKPFIK